MFLLFKHDDERGDVVRILTDEDHKGLRIQATTRDGDPLLLVDVPADEGRLLLAQLKVLYEDRTTAERDESNKGFDAAVDWLLNSAHTGDQDIQNAFWALADGLITEDEVDTLSAVEIRQRREAAKTREPARTS